MMTIQEINQIIEAMTRQSRILAAKTLTYTDNEAVSIQQLFPTWPDGVNENGNFVQGQYIQYKGQLYRIEQPVVIPIESQPPDSEGMLAVYRPASISHEGSLDDPIPWVYGMDCFEGKYYTYEGSIYYCKGTMKPCNWYPGQEGVFQWEKVE